MNKKIILSLLILILVAGGGWWFMKHKKISPDGQKYDTALDSIFFNIYFGMSKEAFYDTCWVLNKKGGFIQGANNLSVQHEITSGLGMPVYMNFYPNFSEKGLYQMPVMYNYEAWAPWNKELDSDTLITRIVKMLEEDYNVSFTKDRTKDGRPAFYNYTGPRKILVTTQDEQFVKVLMENEKYK
jgi:hypothetical protein